MIRTFPFKKIPGQIIIELIRFVGIWLNQEPYDNGVLDVSYPSNITMDQNIAYDKHYKVRFGSYVESHEDHKITNYMEEKQSVLFAWVPMKTFRGAIKYFP